MLGARLSAALASILRVRRVQGLIQTIREAVRKLCRAKALVPLFALVLSGWGKSIRSEQDTSRRESFGLAPAVHSLLLWFVAD